MDLAPLAENKRREENNDGAVELHGPIYSSIEADHATPLSKTPLDVIMTTVSHVLITAFTVYIFYLCYPFSNLFSWHPACMTIGAFLLMAEAIMAMSPNNYLSSKLKRQTRIRLHFILQAIAACFMFSGFLIVFINKNINNKIHFKSWHGIIGLVTVILVAVTAFGGVIALYAIRLKQWIRPAQIKFLHNCIGISTFIVGTVTVVLGIYSHWFQRNSNYTGQVVCSILVSLAAIFALEGAIKSGFTRFKNLYLQQ